MGHYFLDRRYKAVSRSDSTFKKAPNPDPNKPIQAQSFTLFSCHSGVRHIQFYFFHCKQRLRIHQLCSMIDGTGPNTMS